MITPVSAVNYQHKHVIIFASGKGSNAQKIIDHFRKEELKIKVVLIVSNNTTAGVLKIAERENIPFLIIQKNKFITDGYVDDLKKYKADLIVLAGFMWKIPEILIRNYQNKIINIHPALLPKYGGKNMYGNKVHDAVITAGEKESGITIHYVDKIYDNGEIIFQTTCAVDTDDTPKTLADKIHLLEHTNYPLVIENILRSK